MDIKKLKEDLKGIYTEYNQIFETRREQNYKDVVNNLKPGSRIPSINEVKFDGVTKDYLNNDLEKLRDKGSTIVKNGLAEIKAFKTKAPDQEAVNYINMLKLRSSITESDLDIAMEKYGDNYSCYKALEDISKERHLPMNYKNNADDIEAVLENSQRRINNMTVRNCDQGEASKGYMAFEILNVDSIAE